jgi:hypothetical protein
MTYFKGKPFFTHKFVNTKTSLLEKRLMHFCRRNCLFSNILRYRFQIKNVWYLVLNKKNIKLVSNVERPKGTLIVSCVHFNPSKTGRDWAPERIDPMWMSRALWVLIPGRGGTTPVRWNVWNVFRVWIGGLRGFFWWSIIVHDYCTVSLPVRIYIMVLILLYFCSFSAAHPNVNCLHFHAILSVYLLYYFLVLVNKSAISIRG